RELAGSRVQVDQHAVELPRIRGERVCDRGEVGQELLELDALIGDGRRHRAQAVDEAADLCVFRRKRSEQLRGVAQDRIDVALVRCDRLYQCLAQRVDVGP